MFSLAVNIGATPRAESGLTWSSITITARGGQHADTSKPQREDFQMAITEDYDMARDTGLRRSLVLFETALLPDRWMRYDDRIAIRVARSARACQGTVLRHNERCRTLRDR